eukprot:sb/3466705/
MIKLTFPIGVILLLMIGKFGLYIFSLYVFDRSQLDPINLLNPLSKSHFNSGCVTTAKHSFKHSDLSEVPKSELQRIGKIASTIHSKIITDLGMQMNTNRRSTATKSDLKRQEELTKKMIALKLFMHENHKELAKERSTRDADWVSENGQDEWSLNYSHDNNAWTATNPDLKEAPVAAEKQVDEEALKYLAPYYPAPRKATPKKSTPKKSAPKKSAPRTPTPKKSVPNKSDPRNPTPKKSASKKTVPKKVVQVEPSHNHHQLPAINGAPRSGKTSSVKQKPSKPAPSRGIQHSDNTTGDKDDGQDVILIAGGVALFLALTFMIYTTTQ